MSEWRDIETAPKDGTRVLLWADGWSAPQSGQCYGLFWGESYEAGPWAYEPTHWMPLPEPPK